MGLAVLAVLTLFGEVRFKAFMYFVPHDALITVALVIGGPLPTLIVFLLGDVPHRVVTRRLPLATPGAWATYVSYGWASIAGAALLHASPTHSITAAVAVSAVTAGLCATSVNWLLASGLFRSLWHGHRFMTLLREELGAALPVSLVLQSVAALCLLLVAPLGIFMLVPLVALTVMPATGIASLIRSRDVSLMDAGTVTRLYARALATRLGLDRRKRRSLLAAVALSYPSTPCANSNLELARRSGLLRGPLPPAPTNLRVDAADVWKAWQIARQAGERWDEPDGPNGYPRGRLLPIEARILAVAREWAQLTAACGPRLPQPQAALALEALAGTQLDPDIVKMASEIVTVERQFASLETFQPRLDLLPVPRVVRHELLPWALYTYTCA